MGIFDKIKTAIFGSAEAAIPDEAATPVEAPTTVPAGAAPATTAATAAAPAAASTSNRAVDVAPILDAAAKSSGQKLDWRESIVDLMKALDLDSSLTARKQLAEELGYTGEKNGSAEMNTWLHKALMKKLSENGGKVPADLLD